MKNNQPEKLKLAKIDIAKMNTFLAIKLKGGTDTVSAPGQQSAHASQCGNLICY